MKIELGFLQTAFVFSNATTGVVGALDYRVDQQALPAGAIIECVISMGVAPELVWAAWGPKTESRMLHPGILKIEVVCNERDGDRTWTLVQGEDDYEFTKQY